MLFLLLIPALLLIYYYYSKTIPEISAKGKVLLFTLRTIAVLILLILIFNPILNISRTAVYKPQIVFLNDISYSMDLPVGEESKLTLMEKYRKTLEAEIKNNDYEIRDFLFADGIDGRRTSTNLTKTLQEMAKSLNLQHITQIFLLSDGWFGDQQLDIVSRLNIPIWTIHPEYEYEEFNVGINNLFYNPTAYTEDENFIIVDTFADNYDGEADVSLYFEDRLVDKQTVSFTEENLQQITFTQIYNNAGLFPIRVEITVEEEEEDNRKDNIYPGAVRVLDKRSGVYILTDNLNWEIKFLNNALRGDERKDVQVFRIYRGTILKGQDTLLFTDIFPEHLQMMIIVNSGNLNLTTPQIEMLDRFLANGGGLLFIGNPLTELEEILGVRRTTINQTFRSTLSLTTESRKYQTFVNIDQSGIPTIDYLYVEPLLQSTILAKLNNDEQSAAIIYNEYKQGRVLSFTFYNLWRWQLRGDGMKYFDFITNVASWLCNPTETNFIALSDKNSYFLGESVNIRLTAYDETLSIHYGLNPKIYLYDDQDNKIVEEFLTFDSRYYQITIDQLPAGNYRYDIIDDNTGNRAEGSFIVSDIDAERRNRGFNFPLLAYISRQTNGTILLEEDLPGFQLDRAKPTTERRRLEIPLYRHWLIITIFLLAFCTELYLRKKWGLL